MALRILALLLAMLSAASAAKYEAKPGQWTWNVWMSPPYREAYPNWLEFRAKVAALNGIKDTDEAFRRLEPNTMLEYPSIATADISREIELAVAKLKAEREQAVAKLNERIAELEHGLKLADEKLALAAVRTGELPGWFSWGWSFWNILLIALLLAAVAGLFLMHRAAPIAAVPSDYNTVVDERRRLQEENDYLRFFLDKYAYPYELPQDFGSIKGRSRRIYLQRAQSIDGDDAVFVYGTPHPVKVANLKERFANADPKLYDYYGLIKGDIPTSRIRTVRSG